MLSIQHVLIFKHTPSILNKQSTKNSRRCLDNKKDKVLDKSIALDPRIKRTRQALVEAFSELMNEKDFARITVQDVALRAKVNRATFYAHFEDKYALLNHTFAMWLQAVLDENLPPAPILNAENLRRLLLAMCKFLTTCSSSHHRRQLPFETQVQQSLYHTLLTWIERHPIPNPEAVATVISWSIFGAALQWSHQAPAHRPSAATLADTILPLLLAGLPLNLNAQSQSA